MLYILVNPAGLNNSGKLCFPVQFILSVSHDHKVNMFCLSHSSCVEPRYREQAVASLPGAVAPAAQRVSPVYPTTMSGGAAQKRPAQPQSPAPR